MTQEKILEYNKRCALFMGASLKHNQGTAKVTHYILKEKTYLDYTLEFHSDWNWIMEVVEAIEKLKFRFEMAFNEVNLYCILEERRFSYAINYHDCENYGEEMHLTKKESVIQAINQFLIWYNTQKQ